MGFPACHSRSFSLSVRMLMVLAVALAVASSSGVSLEDMEFHAWKLKFGECVPSDFFFFFNCGLAQFPVKTLTVKLECAQCSHTYINTFCHFVSSKGGTREITGLFICH